MGYRVITAGGISKSLLLARHFANYDMITNDINKKKNALNSETDLNLWMIISKLLKVVYYERIVFCCRQENVDETFYGIFVHLSTKNHLRKISKTYKTINNF